MGDDTRSTLHWAEAAFRAANVGLAVYGVKSRAVARVNDEMLRLAGLSREDLDRGHRSFIDATPLENRDRDEAARIELIETGAIQPYRKVFEHRDGRRVPVLITAHVMPEAEVAVVVAQDLSTVEAVEQASEAARQRSAVELGELADAMPTLVWIADALGDVTYYNARLGDFVDVRRDGPHFVWADLCHPEDLAATQEAWRTAHTEGSPYVCEHRLRMADGSFRWHQSRATPYRDEGGAIRRWIGSVTDIHALKTEIEHRQLLAHELDHRVKNSIMIVQTIVDQTLKSGRVAEEVRAGVRDRIAAMSRAHGRLMHTEWRSLQLADLVRDALQAHPPERSSVAGPPLELSPDVAVLFALALHELATNAVKYGALSTETGTVQVTWSLTGAQLSFEWRETGGPPVATPAARGFGSKLLEQALARQLGGQVALHFEPDGLLCRVEANLERMLAEAPTGSPMDNADR